MTLTSHVVSLDLALELRDAGYPQENALFYWRSPLPHYGYNEWSLNDCQMAHGADNVAAPLASELGEALPVECEFYKTAKTTVAHKKGKYCCRYYGDTNHPEYADTEADARARMWLHLRKASLI